MSKAAWQILLQERMIALEQDNLFSEWTKMIGKGKLQAYQDSFARTFGISLCLMSLEGKTLTIWSNSSLFCYYMMKNNRVRCIQERHNAIKAAVADGQTSSFTCYMGLTYFISPVHYKGQVICVAYGGGINLGSDRIRLDNKLADNIPSLSEERYSDMLDLLQNTLELLDLNPVNDESVQGVPSSCNQADNEYLFLQHKLSRREMDIAYAVCQCLSNKQIGEKLFISEKTVKTHISNILSKMEMKDRMQLVMFCKEHDRE